MNELKQNEGRTDESIWNWRDKIGMWIATGALVYFFALAVIEIARAKGWM